MSMIFLAAIAPAMLFLLPLLACHGRELDKLATGAGQATVSDKDLTLLYREIDLDLMEVEIDARRLAAI